MARFRGTVDGGRGEASRLGHASKGLTTEAQSYQGKVVVSLYVKGDDDYTRVTLAPHKGQGRNLVLYDGPVSGAQIMRLAV